MTGDVGEDMQHFRAEGLGVDDDNDPDTENERRVNSSTTKKVH